MSHSILLAAVRGDYKMPQLEERIDYLKEQYDAQIYLLHTPDIMISSSLIREHVQRGESIRYLVPKDVEKYIYQNKLYAKGA